MKIIKSTLLLLTICLTGCASSVDVGEMDLTIDNRDDKIHNLQYYKKSNIEDDLAENIMKNILDNTDNNIWGYYYINCTTHTTEQGNPYDGFLDTFVILALNILAVPRVKITYYNRVEIYIFDAMGNLVDYYDSSESFYQWVGLYFGHNPNKKAKEIYERLINKTIEEISNQSKEINTVLEKIGILEIENVSLAHTNIFSIIK